MCLAETISPILLLLHRYRILPRYSPSCFHFLYELWSRSLCIPVWIFPTLLSVFLHVLACHLRVAVWGETEATWLRFGLGLPESSADLASRPLQKKKIFLKAWPKVTKFIRGERHGIGSCRPFWKRVTAVENQSKPSSAPHRKPWTELCSWDI